MTKDDAVVRVQELSKEVAESMENHQRIRVALDNATSAHNALVGRLNEATDLYNKLNKEEGCELPQ